MDYFRVGATFEKASTLKDGSLRVTFDTQDLDAEKMAKVFQMRKEIGHLIFARPNTTVELPVEKPKGIPKGVNEKSACQRLRAVIFRVWESIGGHGSSDAFYQNEVEKIIDGYKAKLE